MKISKSKSKGFTLIELLVVVAIISLLSSIVLASLKEAREKAKGTAFRQEVEQFIKALELYRLDKGTYPQPYDPIEDNTIYFYQAIPLDDGSVDVSTRLDEAFYSFSDDMSMYINKLPVPNKVNAMFQLRINYTDSGNIMYRGCFGDQTFNSRYVIRISSTQNGFEDWQYGILNGTGIVNYDYRCFSIK